MSPQFLFWLVFSCMVVLAIVARLRRSATHEHLANASNRPTLLFRASRAIAQIVLSIIVALFCVYLGWAWWEMKQLKAFCSEVREGLPISSLPPLAEKYGFSPRWVKSGIVETGKTNQITFVPAASTFGEIACAIRYDESGVISANIDP